MAVGATITCGDYVDQSNGRCTSIDVLREDKLAVICTDTTFTPNLYYYVGKINRREIAWGNYMKYTTGKNPNVALFRAGRADPVQTQSIFVQAQQSPTL